MSNPAIPQHDPDEPLQFEEAEFAGAHPTGLACSACKSPIDDHYYEAAGQVVCEGCRDRIEHAYSGGSKLGRFLKASVLGGLAAVIGAIGYYAVTEATGYNFGLVAVVVGVLVGGGVKRGSGGRGGLFYQLLAVFLTYTSIVLMLIPVLVEVIQGMKPDEEPEEPVQVAAPLDPKAEAPEGDADAKPAEGAAKSAEKAEAVEADAGKAAPAPPEAPQAEPAAAEGKEDKAMAEPADDDEELPSLPQFLLAVLVLAGVAFFMPIQVAIFAPLSGLIYSFALWEAWKINRKQALVINGPYLATRPEAGDDEPDDDHEAPSHGS